MEKFLGVKLLEARPMTLGDYNKYRGWQIPQNEDPNRPGHLVKYSDDYISWSPSDTFNASYRRIDNLTFGLATEASKLGHAVARKGWAGKGLLMYYVPANAYPTMTEVAKKMFGTLAKYNAYFALKQADGTVSTWCPSVGDALAEDWYIVDLVEDNIND